MRRYIVLYKSIIGISIKLLKNYLEVIKLVLDLY